MRGYLSFVLAFLGAAALLSSYSLLAPTSPDLSKALSVERAYGLQMNIKEAAALSMMEGAMAGFDAYDGSHHVDNCVHCPGACLPPPNPNYCDPGRCLLCFREDEARAAAVLGAYAALAGLGAEQPDGDFSWSLVPPVLEAFLKPDPLGSNGFSLDCLLLKSPLGIYVRSESLGISASSELPAGMVIR